MFLADTFLIYIVIGCVVGVVAGLLGIGGGGIVVPSLTVIFLMEGMQQDNIMHMALGTSMATIVVTSISSMWAYHKKGGVIWSVVKMMAPGVIVGTFFATFVASNLSSFYLAIFFSIFMAYISFQMFLNKKPKPTRTLGGYKVQFGAGAVIGAISALVSIGGGSLTTSFLYWQNIDLRKAIGTSAAVGFPISVSGTLGYIINGWHNTDLEHYIIGFVSIPSFLLIAFFSFLTVPIGVKLAHALPIGVVKKAFALLLITLSLKMLSSFI